MKSSTVRHWVSGVFILIAVAMLILGVTVFAERLKGYNYILYWVICMFMTLLAAFTALFNMAAIRRQSRREQRQLAEETFKNIDPRD